MSETPSFASVPVSAFDGAANGGAASPDSLPSTAVQGAQQATLALSASRNFTAWLKARRSSVLFSTYQVGKIFSIGVAADTSLSVVERTFPRCMGLAVSHGGQTVWLSSLYQVWRLDNFIDPGSTFQGYDRVYVPQSSSVTGDIDVHDMAMAADGSMVFVNTLFSCLARLSPSRSFEVVWVPPFISKVAAEDRCHLNGMAMDRGKPRFVTAVSRSDVANGWRDRRASGGLVMDVDSGEVVCDGLSMPHSPRLYQGKLYVLNSGTGEFGIVDPACGVFTPIAFCPGYLRGMTFVDQYAVVGLSRPRDGGNFSGLALHDTLRARDGEARCGLMVIDLHSGDCVEWLTLSGVVSELYDVAILPGVQRPMLIGTLGDDIRRMVRFEGVE